MCAHRRLRFIVMLFIFLFFFSSSNGRLGSDRLLTLQKRFFFHSQQDCTLGDGAPPFPIVRLRCKTTQRIKRHNAFLHTHLPVHGLGPEGGDRQLFSTTTLATTRLGSVGHDFPGAASPHFLLLVAWPC